MPFETFSHKGHGRGRKAATEPRITIHKGEILRLNSAAQAALGDAQDIELLIDVEHGAFAIRAAEHDSETTWRINNGTCGSRSFIRALGIKRASPTRKFSATSSDGTLIVVLAEDEIE